MKVLVIGRNGLGLAPTTPRKARILLKEKRAEVAYRQPFTIRSIEKAAAKANMTVEQFAKVMKEILEEKEWFLDRISSPGNPRKLTPEEIEQLEKEGRL